MPESPRLKHLGIRLFGKGFSAQVDYHLTPVAEGTHFNYSADVACAHWFFRLMGRLFGFIMRGMLRKQIRKLKAVAEA